MKSVVIMAFMFLTLAVGANAQENQRVFTAEEQAIVDLSNSKWDWMSEKNVEKLAELFHGTATVYSRIHLNSVVGGNAVRFPFIVTEVYVMENGKWQLSTLAFTRTLGE